MSFLVLPHLGIGEGAAIGDAGVDEVTVRAVGGVWRGLPVMRWLARQKVANSLKSRWIASPFARMLLFQPADAVASRQ